MTALLVIIYIAFISLGLPDSLLGSAWPVMRVDLSASFETAGYAAMMAQGGTILSSLLSSRLIARFGTGRVTVTSVAMTAIALVGYSLAPNVWALYLCAIPLGLGAGSVDVALNNFVALHYKAKHMNWLHCFWGIGATVGPMILATQLGRQGGWRAGYVIIAILQGALVAALLGTLRLWKRAPGAESAGGAGGFVGNREALRLPHMKLALVGFAFFCATEATGGLWTASYFTAVKGLPAATGALIASAYYGAITAGRLLSGFATFKLSNAALIRAGQLVCAGGAVLIALPLPTPLNVAGALLVGLGTAPIFPSMLHETPRRFGLRASQAAISLEMAFTYVGNTLAPPLFGLAARFAGVALYPYAILLLTLVMLAASELMELRLKRRAA